jgi:uncharacterized protein involved in exopolysaccharide biosynthesis
MERRNVNGVFGRRRHARPSSSSMQDSRLVGPRDLLRILFRHKIKVASFFVTTLVISALGLVFIPKTYVSEARLYIKVGRHSVGISPAATQGQGLTIQESRENEIRSMVDLISSRTILERVVNTIGPQVIIKSDLNAKSTGDEKRDGDGMILDKAINKLADDITVYAGKKSSLISVSCKSNSPKLSQKIVGELISVYRNHHLDVNSTHTFEFFGKQLKVIEAETRIVSDELAAIKERIGVSSIEGQRVVLEKTVTDLNNEMQGLEADISEAKSRLEILKHETPNFDPADLRSGTSLTAAALDNMREELYRLQIEKRRLETRYETQHPTIRKITAQLEQSTADLRREELLIAASTLASSTARRGSLKESYEKLTAQLNSLLKHEPTINQYVERLEILKDRHGAIAKRMEQSRLAEELDSEKVSNIKVEQDASFIPKAVSPKKSIVLLLGFLAGSIGGLGLATTCEFLDHSYKTPEQAEASLNLPVLLSIPATPGHSSPLT